MFHPAHKTHRPRSLPAIAGCGFALALALAGCAREDRLDVAQLVRRYNLLVAEAYRRGDVKLIDPVVGAKEGRRIAGLIGVRSDLGLRLDSELLSLEVAGVRCSDAELRVRTREHWRYCDRRVGTNQQVGEESLDAYEMLYVFKRDGKAWLVDEIQFAAPPQVGRRQMAWLADRGTERAEPETRIAHEKW